MIPYRPGRFLARHKIRNAAIAVLLVIAGIVILSAKLGSQRQATTDLPLVADEQPGQAPRALAEAAGTPYEKQLDQQAPTPDTSALDAMKNALKELREARDKDKREIDQLRAELTAKSTTPQQTAQTSQVDPEAQRRAQEAREMAKMAVLEERMARASPLAAIRHDREPSKANSHISYMTSPYYLAGGTVASCILDSGINTEHGTDVFARITSPVYDTYTMRHVLIPQDARLIGTYRGTLFGEETVDVTWETLEYKGVKIELKGQPGGDESGQSGIAGDVDHKWGKVIASIFVESGQAASIVATGVAGDTAAERAGGMAVQRAVQSGTNQLSRTMNVTPTIHVPPSTRCTMQLRTPLELPPV